MNQTEREQHQFPGKEGAPPPTTNGAREIGSRSARSALSRYPVVFILIGITGVIFLLQVLAGALYGFDLIIALGAKDAGAIDSGQIWRFVTPVFIHGGVLHFGVNMYSLYVVGRPVEIFFGHWRMLAIYLLSGIAGVLLSLALSPDTLSVGASGAIFGLLGALGVFYFLNRSTFGEAGSIQLRQIVMVALLNLALGLSPGIDNWGHLGGLLYGAALTWFIGPQYSLQRDEITDRPYIRDQRPWGKVWPVVLVGAAVLLILAIVLMI